MTDWSGHIDVLVVAGIFIFAQTFINLCLLGKINKRHDGKTQS